MRFILTLFLSFICSASLWSQDVVADSTKIIDPKYREDQFYFAITYNLLAEKPSNVSQTGFSSGFHLGYIRDMPLNERRNFGIGLGLGFSLNSYNHNIYVYKNETGEIAYINLSDSDINYTKNKFSTYLVEMPFELRWRTSTEDEYRFWRIYTGFKVGYLVASSTKFKGDIGTVKNSNIKDFNDFQYGLTLSAGYNTWNFHIYYSLNPILSKDAQLGEQAIDMFAVKFGLIFYIL
ncbi:porin family protein [Xanthomarina spongicola]|uniref:Outer membrane protein with beta-barrel domain n=1 Tax=Xanthomarina spongicola TaxID=570520 RepID=A0A316DSV1_9FLAO|nr:porin family protein [Xanthomarina spongicola]PWK20846.1 outer membrane protein with beta-barrel domain [Xanthomarina spongicola]